MEKKYEENIKELWDVYNQTNVGISEREMNTILERKKRREKNVIEAMLTKNYPNICLI